MINRNKNRFFYILIFSIIVFNLRINAFDSDDIKPEDYEALYIKLAETVLRKNTYELFTLYRRELTDRINHKEWIIIEKKYNEYTNSKIAYFMENNVKSNNDCVAGSFTEYLIYQLKVFGISAFIGMYCADFEMYLEEIISVHTTLTQDDLNEVNYLVGYTNLFFEHENK